jgi:hypothetical protein
MAYPPKIEKALKVLDAAGVPKRQAAPWTYRLLWRLGIPARPPQFQRPLVSLAISLALFLILYPATYMLIHWLISGSEEISRSSFIGGWIGTFIGTGISLAVGAAGRRKYDLPHWSAIDDIASRFD